MSIALIILLVNPHLYMPAIRSYALSICSGAGMFALMGAYAAGSTQHLRTSIYVFVFVMVVMFVIARVVLYSESNRNGSTHGDPKPLNGDFQGKKKHAEPKYLMLLGILVASVTYQAGLSPTGGTWQSNNDWYSAGNPLLHDNRRSQYLALFYCNSTSFVASIVVIVLLLPQWPNGRELSLKVMKTTIFLDLLALLGAYAAGSSREWKTSVYVVALIIAVLAYVLILIMLAFSCCRTGTDIVSPRDDNVGDQGIAPPPQEQTNVGISAP